MERKIFRIALASLAAFCWSGFSHAQIIISNVKWQVKVPKSNIYSVADRVEINPKNCKMMNLRILAFLENDSGKDIKGIVIRYALRFRVKRFGSKTGDAVWALPFHLEEIRVSEVKAGAARTVKIPNINLSTELRKLKSNGYWIDAVGIEMMVEPRPGDDLSRSAYQSLIKVDIAEE